MLLVLFATTLLGCREPTIATQVIVRFEADEALATRASALRLIVFRQDAERWERTERLGGTLSLPVTLPLEPRDGDASRSFHVVGELLDADGGVFATERAIGGYLRGERRYVTLRFVASCVGRRCADDERCFAGACASACVDPSTEPPHSEPTRPVPCENAMDAGVADAGADAGADAALEDASDAALDAGPACLAVESVDLGSNHLCVLLEGGVIRCSGVNSRGQLGVGSTSVVEGFAPPVEGGPWRELVIGTSASCALDAADGLYCWGESPPGRLGLTDAEADTTSPQRVLGTGGTSTFRRVALGAGHGCAPRVIAAPSVFCFGRNDYGQAGGDPSGDLVAPATSRMLGSAFAVAAGSTFTCAARTGAPSTVCWGRNDFGQLGTPSGELEMSGVPQSANVRAFALTAGAAFACVLRDPDRQVVCWGDNRRGQSGAAIRREVGRTNVPLPEGAVGRSIAAGDQHVCVVTDDDGLYCWGSNMNGELGRGALGPSDPAPARALGEGYVAVAAASDRTCAITREGALLCWGRGSGTPRPVCVPAME